MRFNLFTKCFVSKVPNKSGEAAVPASVVNNAEFYCVFNLTFALQ